MFVRALELTEFRSWDALAVRFDERVIALVGHNGSGKTSLLEAMWYCASLGSHRTSADAALVRDGGTAGIVRVDVERGETARTERVELEVVTRGRARARLGGAPVGRRRDVLGVLRAQIFAPERMAIVRADPSDRRRFIDELLVQLNPRYHGVIRDYERALRQRNALLRDGAGSARGTEGLEAWDAALLGPGAELAAGRARAIERLRPHARAAFEAVGGDTTFAVDYVPNIPPPLTEERRSIPAWHTSMAARLAERRQDELARGVTLVGPHRDDLAIVLGGMPARTHASHGESWLAAVALVLGAHAALSEAIGEEPVLLLDDPFTLLDPQRRERLVPALPAGAQIILTAADPTEVPVSLGARSIDVEALRRGGGKNA